MNKIVGLGLGAAAVVLAAVVGLQLLGSPGGGTGGQTSPSPSAELSQLPSAAATPRAAGDEDLPPGTYFARPLAAASDSLTVTFTVPEGWTFLAGNTLVPTDDPGTGAPGGIAIQFDDVTALHGDPCSWLDAAADISVGSAADDLVDALVAHTEYEASDPVEITIGGYRGKRVDVVYPTEPFVGDTANAPECDEGRYRLWSTVAHGRDGIYAQGPANRWQANVLNIEGRRLVVIVQDFPGTSAADRAELDAIVDSIGIEP